MSNWTCILVLSILLAAPSRAADFVTFESDPVRPLALSRSGDRLYAVNTPDARLEIFDVSRGRFAHLYSVPVGLEPVAVAVHPSRPQVWVVNHLSDSVSIVDVSLSPPRVVRTLFVGDEPRDVVFAGPAHDRAFVSTAHRGPHSPHPRGEFATPGIGRADVWVFDVRAPGDPITIVTLFGDRPRPLAATPDGSTVYAGIYRSGNRTAVVRRFFVCGGGVHAPPCEVGEGQYPGGSPAPNDNHQGVVAPHAGLIVQYDEADAEWQDELGRSWNDAIPFDLPDLDVFSIDAMAAVPTQRKAFSGAGTILFNMVVNPRTGTLYVSNTEAHNEVRFEGPGLYAEGLKAPGVPLTTQGRLHEARITVIQNGKVRPRHLNKHIDYTERPAPPGVKDLSLATPTAMVVTHDGRELYVAAFGSAKIGVFSTRALEDDSFQPDVGSHIPLRGGGPVGLALDEHRQRLFVLTRFDNTVSEIDLLTRREGRRRPMYNPEPARVVEGRPFLYDAHYTSSNGEASCGACHVFGDMDDLAWDLGNPDGNMVLFKGIKMCCNPFFPRAFHPMKGPLITQSLRGLPNHGPLHWRGDRNGLNADPPTSSLDVEAAFKEFNVAFEGLVGRTGPLTEVEMQAFADFALEIVYPPNPLRRLDNGLRPDEARGRDLFFDRSDSFGNQFSCNECHRFDPEAGQFGSTGIHSQTIIKIPHLRNLYQKVGMFGAPVFPEAQRDGPPQGYTGLQIRGFGFSSTGTSDTVTRILSGLGFTLRNDDEKRDVEAFVLAAPSNLAPIVGQQATVTHDRSPRDLDQLDLLIERAQAVYPSLGQPDARECDLVAHAVVDHVARGWAFDAVSSREFVPDRADDPPWTLDELMALLDGTCRHADSADADWIRLIEEVRSRVERHLPPQLARALLHWLDALDAPRSGPSECEAKAITFTCGPPGTGRRMALDRDRDGLLDGDERP